MRYRVAICEKNFEDKPLAYFHSYKWNVQENVPLTSSGSNFLPPDMREDARVFSTKREANETVKDLKSNINYVDELVTAKSGNRISWPEWAQFVVVRA
jgi:hypothetical protein